MAKQRSMQILFPLGGENRRGGYAQRQPPFTSPGAVNTRGICPFERRVRGGSRPGLVKFSEHYFGETITAVASVTYIDRSGQRQQELAVIADGSFKILHGESVEATTAYLATDDGVRIIDESGRFIIFDSTVSSVSPIATSSSFQIVEKGGKLYIPDDFLRRYDPITGAVTRVKNAPTGQPLLCVYQERLVLSGEDHMYYMSAQADEEDWNAGADMGNAGRAVFGHVGDGGRIGEKINAMLPWQDTMIFFGTADNLWAVQGNLSADSGSRRNISPHVGVLGPNAICATPGGVLLFMARDGLYSWSIGGSEHPQPFSPVVVPEEFRDIDTTETDVIMQYDHKSRGVHLFLTPEAGNGKHWWIDVENKALWPIKLRTPHQPIAVGAIPVEGYSDILLGCKDGYLRRYDSEAETDDGEDMFSHLLIGPLHIAGEDGFDGMIAEIVSAFAEGTEGIEWALITGSTAEDATDRAVAEVQALVNEEYV